MQPSQWQDHSVDDNDKADLNRPKAFYQVAIDIPGFGSTPGPPHDTFASAELLAEIVTSLGKEYAFAVVAFQQASSALLTALLAKPRLAAFVLLREVRLWG